MDIKVDLNTVIVFDLDDTLYNELDFLKSAYQSIAAELMPEDWLQLYTTMFSMYRNGENVFEFLVAEFNVDKELLITKYRNHIPKIELFDGAFDLIKNIKSKGGKLAIITDGRSKTQMAKIHSLGLINYIDKIVISEDIGTEKPNVNNFLIIEKHFPDSNYCYIADNLKKDFISPKALGWKTIGLVDNGKNIHPNSKEFMKDKYRPKFFILDLKEINII